MMMNIYNRLQEQKWFLLGLAILGWVVVVNLFPTGYIVLGGDVLQPINLKEQFANFHYGWFSGRTSLFYGLFYLLDILGVTSTGQLSWYLGIFVFGAYLSFFLFSRLIFPSVSRQISLVMSLFYATNVYTLYIFTSTWGFTSYQVLYVFIPALTGLFMQMLQTRKNIFLLFFLLVVFLASTSFSNPAFAVSLGIYFLLLTIALFVFRFTPFDRDAVKRIVLLLIGAVFLNAYWILPLVPQTQAGAEELSNSSVVVLSETLVKTSNAIFDTIRLLTTSEQDKYYPYNFPYPSVSWMKYIVIILTFIPFFLVLAGVFSRKSAEQKRLYSIFFSLFVVFIALVARVRFPFDSFNIVFFQLPGLNALRGWDKLAIYTPFILSVLLLGFLSLQEKRRYFRRVLIGFSIIAVFLALPFYTGGIQTELSYILSGNKKKDFNSAKYSALVKIPEPYYSVADTFKKDSSDSKISILPYSPGSSVGRINLPELKINGPHFVNALYAKKYVELNDYYINKWVFADEFDKSEYDPKWITDLYGLIGIEYVFYHHDARPRATEAFESARQYFEKQNILHPLTQNEWFTLYRLDKQYLFPYVYTNPDAMILGSSIDVLSEKIGVFRSHMSSLEYVQENPREIIVSTDILSPKSFVFLNEKYDPLFRAEYIAPDGKRTLLVRNDNVRYANAWKIDRVDPTGKIDIYYLPVHLLYIGEWISGIALLCVILGIGLILKKKNNE